MITAIKNFNTFTADGKPVTVTLYRGNSTDTKPVDCANGSEFEEIDTSDKYLFDGASAEWVKKNSSIGGGLPTPTAADNGKAVIVSAQATEGAVIVPEQTVTIPEVQPDMPAWVVVDNANTSLFTVGTQVIATVDGVTFVATVIQEGEGDSVVAFADATEDLGFVLFNSEFYFLNNSLHEGDTAVIKLCVVENTYSYGFGGSTLLVHASNVPEPPESGTVYSFPSDTVIDKTYNEMKNALLAGRTVTLVASMSGSDGEIISTLGLVTLDAFDGEYNVTFTAYNTPEIQYYGFFTAYDPDGQMTC